MEESSLTRDRATPYYWIVICPEPYVRGGGLWAHWYRENCVAVGWPPPSWTLEGPSEDLGWTYARNRLKEIRPGDRVIPFLLKWRLGPVGTVKEVLAGDAEWNQTVGKGDYLGSDLESELGRRVLVAWDQQSMPPDGRCALVPQEQRPPGPLSKHVIERLPDETFQKLCSVLANPSNWIDIAPSLPTVAGGRFAIAGPQIETEVEAAPLSLPVAELALLERDLQKLLSRNLGRIEKGLTPHPDYQLEEYPCDVGRLDFLCKDAENNWVVIELKAGWIGDDAVGQILGYMSWVKDNLPDGSTVRGIIIGKSASGRVKAAIKLFPAISIKQFTLDCRIDEMA
jgi:hypothetical protein